MGVEAKVEGGRIHSSVAEIGREEGNRILEEVWFEIMSTPACEKGTLTMSTHGYPWGGGVPYPCCGGYDCCGG